MNTAWNKGLIKKRDKYELCSCPLQIVAYIVVLCGSVLSYSPPLMMPVHVNKLATLFLQLPSRYQALIVVVYCDFLARLKMVEEI